MGVCIPPCQNACTPGAGQCSFGRPQSCDQGPTGCFIWRDQPVCGGDQQCVSGKCHSVCGADEFESCPTGEICTGLTEGRFCLPIDGDAGVGGGSGGTGGGTGTGGGGLDAGAAGGETHSSGSGEEMTPGGNGRIGAVAMGCNCNSVDAGLLPLLALGLTLLRRRRS